jgi:hypothetical protein
MNSKIKRVQYAQTRHKIQKGFFYVFGGLAIMAMLCMTLDP